MTRLRPPEAARAAAAPATIRAASVKNGAKNIKEQDKVSSLTYTIGGLLHGKGETGKVPQGSFLRSEEATNGGWIPTYLWQSWKPTTLCRI